MKSKFHVLIAEEEGETASILDHSFKRLGCCTRQVPNSDSAKKELEKKRYDAVFAGLCVRDTGARPLARWVKSNELETKFFVVTSWKGQLAPNLLLMDGIHGIVRKPLIFSEIKDVMLQHFG